MEDTHSAENELFTKALRFLWERRLAKYGAEADLVPVLKAPEKPGGSG